MKSVKKSKKNANAQTETFIPQHLYIEDYIWYNKSEPDGSNQDDKDRGVIVIDLGE